MLTEKKEGKFIHQSQSDWKHLEERLKVRISSHFHFSLLIKIIASWLNPLRAKGPMEPALISGFCSVKRMRVFGYHHTPLCLVHQNIFIIPGMSNHIAASEANSLLFGTQCNLRMSLATNMRYIRSAVQVHTVVGPSHMVHYGFIVGLWLGFIL